MKNRLLNFSKNLIIMLGLVVTMLLLFTTISYGADGDSLGKMMRSTVSGWYRFITKLSLAIFSIVYIVILLKLLADRTPERIKKAKESVIRFLLMFTIITFLHYIMLAVIILNKRGVNTALRMGSSLSGIHGKDDEYDLYETALSKAYEISAVPGFIGLVMYFLLVFYTYKFVFIYAKRYINVIVLMLLAPIMFVVSSTKKILTGVSDNSIKKWIKEFLFNVFIQSLHAIFYATLIGFTLKLSDDGENLVGALIVLIIFGFIFKIDGIIRKMFNFVGGSTKIKASKTASVLLDTANMAGSFAGGKMESGVNKFESGATKFGENISTFRETAKTDGFLNTAKANIQTKFKELPGEALDGIKEMPGKALNGAKEMGGKALDSAKKVGGMALDKTKSKAESALDYGKNIAKEAKDYKSILSGERVKENLTADEIVKQQHIMDEAKGLEGLRQNIQNVGFSVSRTVKRTARNSLRNIKTIYNKADLFTRKKIREIEDDLKEMKSDVINDIEIVKRIPKIMKKTYKRREYIKKSDGINIDTTNTMMLVIDTEADLEEVVSELRNELGNNISISGFMFRKVGPQIFLSSEIGSSRLGMGVLADDRYEELADRRLNSVITGKKFTKKRLKKPSRLQAKRETKKALKTSKSVLKENKKINKVYKFSRFNPDTVRKINRMMLKKTRQENRYLIVLNDVYESVQNGTLKATGTYGTTGRARFSFDIKATKKDIVRGIRNIKLRQKVAVSNYRELERKTKDIERANEIGDKAMTASKIIRVGFKDIDNMTPGQLGLRKMIRYGDVLPMANGMFLVKKKTSSKERVKATGIVKEDKVIQFVITDEGKLAQQIVSLDGKIIQQAVNEKGEKVGHEQKLEQVVQKININNQSEELRPHLFGTAREENNQQKLRPQLFRKVRRENNQSEEIRPQLFRTTRRENAQQEVRPQLFRRVIRRENNQSEEIRPQLFRTTRRENTQQEVKPRLYRIARRENAQQEVKPRLYRIARRENAQPEVKPRLFRTTRKENEQQEIRPRFSQVINDNTKVRGKIKAEKKSEQKKVISINGVKSRIKFNNFHESFVPVQESTSVPRNSKAQLENLENVVGTIASQPQEYDTQDERIVQHIVTLEGEIVEQVINSNNEIETEKYVILDKGVNNIVEQMTEAISNEELELPENVPMNKKIEKFEDLLEGLRTERTQSLLDQVLESSTEEEKELDTILADVAIQTKNVNLKTLDFEDEETKKVALDHMVNSGVLTSSEAEDDDIVGEAIDILNKRVEVLSESDNDIIFDKALEMDYVRSVEEKLNIGEFTATNVFPKKPETSEEKVENLSELLKTIAVNRVEELTAYPRGVLLETADAMKDVINNAKEGTKSKEELDYEKALEKAEARWAKVHKTTPDEHIVEKITRKGGKSENGSENEIVKITLQFFGAIKNPPQKVSLTNRDTIKAFYDKVPKLDGADLKKTQERFLQIYGSKLEELQLMPFTFARTPVEEMDNWSIYVVRKDEENNEEQDDEEYKKEGQDEKIEELQEKKQEEIQESVLALIDKYYVLLKREFISFIDDTQITSFDEIHNDPSNAQNLYRRFYKILHQNGEKNVNKKAKQLVDNIHKDIRFKNILKEKAKEILANRLLEQEKEKTKNKYEIKSEEETEKQASKVISIEEVRRRKAEEKEKLKEQVLDQASSDIQELLKGLGEIKEMQKLYIDVDDNKKEKQKAMKLDF